MDFILYYSVLPLLCISAWFQCITVTSIYIFWEITVLVSAKLYSHKVTVLFCQLNKSQMGFGKSHSHGWSRTNQRKNWGTFYAKGVNVIRIFNSVQSTWLEFRDVTGPVFLSNCKVLYHNNNEIIMTRKNEI